MMQSQKYNGVTEKRPGGTYGSGRSWTQPLLLMQNDEELRLGSDPDRKRFPTIDDACEKVQELSTLLNRLSEFKYPLDVRRGIRKGVKKRMNHERESRQIKASGRTYFLDVEKTKEGKPYLRITESRKSGEDKWKRNYINVFPEDADEFAQAVSEMAAKLSEDKN